MAPASGNKYTGAADVVLLAPGLMPFSNASGNPKHPHAKDFNLRSKGPSSLPGDPGEAARDRAGEMSHARVLSPS